MSIYQNTNHIIAKNISSGSITAIQITGGNGSGYTSLPTGSLCSSVYSIVYPPKYPFLYCEDY